MAGAPTPAPERVKEVFAQATQQPAEQRAAFIERACAGDAALLAEVKSFVQAMDDAAAAGFFASPTHEKASSSTPTLVAAPNASMSSEGPGAVIGPYKLLQLIGEGGFGSVFMAEQSKPVQRKVALKIIKLGMDTKQVVARFEQERQALAVMDHANIAKVLDAGATETGRPFFVMELVKGEPITDYCDRNNLSISHRLELFAQVCNAVQHAHTKGIIHRDIKPSNILVSTQDGRPMAKVIDFGIAKATAAQLYEKTLFTEHKTLIGTPEYMSPEQAEGSMDIDTRTDVYSLGVLLYELLTGATPFDSRSLRSAAFGEMQRIIREVDPPKPSTRLSQNTESIGNVAASRRLEPRRLSSIVRGELDWIVMKALEKDRSRRYETASGLAADIAHYLTGEAVVAAPPSVAYRFKKFVSRHKGVVVSGSAVAAALLVGVIGFAWQASIARQQRDNAVQAQIAEAAQRKTADEQRDRAVKAESETKKRADELAKVSEFQSQMLNQIDTAGAGLTLMNDIRARYDAALTRSSVPEADRAARADAFSRELAHVNATDTAVQMIDQTILKPAIETIDTQFKDQPAVDAALRQSMASLYRTLGLYEAALPLQHRSLATRRRVLGDDQRDTINSLVETARLLLEQGELPQAEPYLREAIDRSRRVNGNQSVDTLSALNYMGRLLVAQGRLAEAEPYVRESMDTARSALGEDRPDTVNFIGEMGLLLKDQGKLDQAEPLLREAMDMSRRVNPPDSTDTLNAINNLAVVLLYQGKWSEAEGYFREVLSDNRRVRGEEHPNTLMSMCNLGVLLTKQGKLTEAEGYYRRVLAKRRRVLGDEHHDTLTAVSNLADCLRAQDKLDEASPLAREAMDGYRRTLGDEHRDTLIAINIYGYLLIQQGRPEEAAVYWREAYEKGKRALGADHPDVVVWTHNLGMLLKTQGKLAEAEPLVRESYETSRRVNGPEHPDTLQNARSLAGVLEAQKRASDALSLYREVLAARRRVFGNDHAATLESMDDVAAMLRSMGGEANLAEARTLYGESLGVCERLYGKDDWRTGVALLREGRVLGDMQRFGEAEPLLIDSQRVISTAQDVPAARTKQSVDALATMYEAWDKAEPGQGHDAKAAQWKAKRDAMTAPAPHPPPATTPAAPNAPTTRTNTEPAANQP